MPAFAYFVEESELVPIDAADLARVQTAFKDAIKPLRLAVVAAHSYFIFLAKMWPRLVLRDGELFIQAPDYASRAQPLREDSVYQKQMASMRAAFSALNGPIEVLVVRLERAGLEVRYARNVEALRQFRNEVANEVLKKIDDDPRHAVEFIRDDLQWYVRYLSRIDRSHAGEYSELASLLRQIQFMPKKEVAPKGLGLKERLEEVLRLMAELVDVVGHNEVLFQHGTLGAERQARSAKKQSQYNIERHLREEVDKLIVHVNSDSQVKTVLGDKVERLLSFENFAVFSGIVDKFKRSIDARFTSLSVSMLMKRMNGLIELVRKLSPGDADVLAHLFVKIRTSREFELVQSEAEGELASQRELGGLRRYLL